MSFRQVKKDKTRDQLVEVALDLFLRQGFTRTTIEQITGLANVSRRTFFRYFPSKQDVILAWYEQLTEGLEQKLRSRPAQEALWTSLQITFTSLIEPYEKHTDRVKALREMFFSTPQILSKKYEGLMIWRHDLLPVVQERLPHTFEGDLRAHVLLYAAMSTFDAAYDAWLTAGGKGDVRQSLEAAYRELTPTFKAQAS